MTPPAPLTLAQTLPACGPAWPLPIEPSGLPWPAARPAASALARNGVCERSMSVSWIEFVQDRSVASLRNRTGGNQGGDSATPPAAQRIGRSRSRAAQFQRSALLVASPSRAQRGV